MLTSDLGGGKTTFVRGLARGLGSRDHVASPTFTISRQYKGNEERMLTLYHFDFYRLDDPGVVSAELAEVIDDPEAVVAVEWPTIVGSVLPAKAITVSIANSCETARRITITYPETLKYVFAGVN